MRCRPIILVRLESGPDMAGPTDFHRTAYGRYCIFTWVQSGAVLALDGLYPNPEFGSYFIAWAVTSTGLVLPTKFKVLVDLNIALLIGRPIGNVKFDLCKQLLNLGLG